jgi:hypothetical protein
MKLSTSIAVLASMVFSVSSHAATYGCKDERGKLYISKTPCKNELLQKNKRRGISEEEMSYLVKVQSALDKVSKKNRNIYSDETGKYMVEGCFSTSTKVYNKGAVISFRGYRFQCMNYHKSGVARYGFHAIDYVKACHQEPKNRSCKSMDASSRQQLFSQISG